ncbi:radical SAM/SPASM domain-containing protein [Vallitalea guaymasensis]|uniref:Radical SAM protein n=1 Tax=Vallitalea guaymasensis TaxID=1185412 RepID=A0A8J8SD68_9FIRM|nr:radical SAM protein [Vallitalea guaymasensis]QUH30578.1 radical SAM protein [Vallitalea guaymasensis]
MLEKNSFSLPTNLFLSITNRCNLKCPHCYLDSSAQYNDLDTKAWIKIARDTAKAKIFSIVITGGEPLVRKDFIDIIEAFDIWQTLKLNTNATLINDKIAKFIAGRFLTVMVSIDGPQLIHDSIRGKGSYNKTVQGLKMLMNYLDKSKIYINCTISKKNAKYMEQTINDMLSLGINNLMFGEAINVGRLDSQDNDQFSLSIIDKLYIANKIKFLQNKYGKEIDISTDYFEDYINLFKSITDCSYSGLSDIPLINCGAGFKSAAILYDGYMVPCNMLSQDFCDDEDNVLVNSIEDIWKHSRRFIQWRDQKNIKISDICTECDLKSRCYGGCRAESYYKYKNLKNRCDSNCIINEVDKQII